MNSEDKKIFQDLFSPGSGTITIISHTSPDGDAIGSSLAVCKALQSLGKTARVVLPDLYPEYYAWMPGVPDIVIASGKDKEIAECLIRNSEVLLVMDMNAVRRAEKMDEWILNSPATRLLIDHHVDPEPVFSHIYGRTNVSSTSELVYEILSAFCPQVIDIDIATNIYVGIATDTGTFFHSCPYPATFNVIAELIKRGVDNIQINQRVYNTFSENRIRLLGYCLSEKLHVMPEYGVAYIYISLEELRRFNHQVGDTEGIVNYGLSIQGVNVAALFYVKDDGVVKLSLRSEGDVDVNVIARKYFNGGGHKNASGAYFHGPLEDAVELFNKAVRETFPKK